MNIGVDASCWANQRGFGRYTREILSALVEVDRNNHYTFLIDRHSRAGVDFPAGVTPVVVPTRYAASAAAAADGYRPVSDILRMTWATRQRFDVFFYPAVYSFFPIIPGPKCIVTFHDAIAERLPELTFPNERARLFWKAKSWLALQQATLVLTVSEYARTCLIQQWGLSPDRVRAVLEAPSAVFRPAHDRQMLAELLHRFDIPQDTPYFIYVGGISPHKNLKFLIDVFSRVTADPRFSNVRLLLVGDYKKDVFLSSFPSLSQALDHHAGASRVVFTGFIPDEELVHLYSGALALVFPSLDEGFGLPAVEAMACGLPVLASRAGSLPEIVGEAGVYFDPRNEAELADALSRILTDAPLRQDLSARSLTRASDFSWNRTATNLLEIFRQVSPRG